MVFFIFIQILIQPSVSPDQTLQKGVSDQGLHCLPMSQKKMSGLYGLTQVQKIAINLMY